MTTSSHRGDSPDEVVFFLAQATRDRFTRYLVLLVGPDEAVEESLIAAAREEAGAWG